jgi:hypothetical protein
VLLSCTIGQQHRRRFGDVRSALQDPVTRRSDSVRSEIGGRGGAFVSVVWKSV